MQRNKDKPLGNQTNKLEKIRQQVGGLEVLEAGLEFAENKIRDSEDKYQRLFELSPLGIVVLDMKGVITACNSAVYMKSGYSKEDFIGKHFSQVATIRARDIPKFIKIFASLIKGKVPKPFETIYTRKDGTTGWTEAYISLMKSGSKKVGIQVIQNDITERKQAEEKLQQSEERYRAIFEDPTSANVYFDREGRLVLVNQKAAQIIGKPVKDIVGKHTKYMYPARPNDMYWERVRSALETCETAEYTDYIESTDKWFLTRIVPICDASGTIIGAQASTGDITEGKKAEEELRIQSEILRNMKEGVLLTSSSDRKMLYANPTFEEMFGYGPGELIGKDVTILNAPGERTPKETAAEIIKHLDENGVWYGEVHNIKKDGTHFWNRASISEFEHPVYGRVDVNVLEDITERKEAESELRQSEENYKQLAESISDVFFAFDEELRYTYWNKASEELTGISVRDALGKHFYDIFPRDEQSRKAEDNYLKALRTKQPRHFENEFRLGDKDLVFEISAYPSTGGLSVFVKDITERKWAEEALKLAEENFHRSIDDSPMGIRIVTADGRLLYANKAILDIYGYSSIEELKNTPTKQRYTPKAYAEHRERARKRKVGEFVPSSYEISIVRKDGRVRYLHAFRKEVLWNGARQFQTLYQDITERKQAEEREEQLQQELILNSRLATVGEMAAGIAHEINNPLTGVVGFAGLLVKKGLPEDIRNDVNIIYDGAQRIASITSRMLTFARQNRPERTSTNINDIIETTLAMRSYEMESSNIKVTTELAPDLPVTMVDAGQMQQVFLNIILNAEIEMKKAHQGSNLTVKTERINNTIRVSFKDNGSGIPKKNLERIFEPFFTTREIGEGAGLGLSVSYGIVTQHGGKIYAQSRLGKGATFIVELPIVNEAEQLKFAEPATEKKKVAGAKILVVDDEPIVQDLFNEVLSDEGYKIEIVGNGNDALERLGSKDYDVILLDVKLPGMSGIEIYEHIQKTAKSLASRVIFVTGDVMSADTMTYVLSSGIPYITKPFDAEQLLKGIDRILSQKP